SFLYWMCYWKEAIEQIESMSEACFNPSYTGCATGSRSLSFLAIHPLPVSILLILDVLLEDLYHASPSSLFAYSFNPSYTRCSALAYFFCPSYTGGATGRIHSDRS